MAIDVPSVLGCVAGFCIVGFVCYSTRPRQDGARLVRTQALEAWNRRQQEATRLKTDPSARDKAIQRSLLVQRVIAKEGKTFTLGQLVEGLDADGDDSSFDDDDDVDPLAESGHQCSLEENEEESSDCAICLEPFRVGDVVAFSRAEGTKCHHPFHRECILLWFTKRDDCPKCRETILNSDNENENIEVDPMKENTFQEQSMVFVILDSLVTQVRRVSFSLAASTFDTAESEMLGENEDEQDLLYRTRKDQPSPFRRVVSYGDALKPDRSGCRRRSNSMTHAS